MKESFVRCGHQQLDVLFPRIKGFMTADITDWNPLGVPLRGYRTPDSPSLWLRDNADMMRAFKYWEPDMKSLIDHFAETQTARGWLFDYVSMIPEKVPCERENWAKYVRVPVEADVEYRFVNAAYIAWQATGDDRWLKKLLPHLERALEYIITDPWRWDPKHKLVKRGYTIDTWDFDYTAGRHQWLNFQINEHTFWGIMHGDNSGYYLAFKQMAAFYTHLGNKKRANHWTVFAEAFRKRANKVCFNGTFYTHHVHLVPVTIDGVNESEQLSLSNPMDINRGMATHAIATSILREYQQRAATTRAFAPWFSIDPPFPAGIYGDPKIKPGAYCNGGIMPLVGGEIARAAFDHGFEEYAVQQLLKYEELTKNNTSFLWYFPDGEPASIETSTSPDALPRDAWGSSSMLSALTEGLAGIVDQQKLFQNVRLSPRWIAAGRPEASACMAYGASGAFFEYTFAHDEAKKEILLDLKGNAIVDLHLLLPGRVKVKELLVNGKKVTYKNTTIETSAYVDARLPLRKSARLLVRYA